MGHVSPKRGRDSDRPKMHLLRLMREKHRMGRRTRCIRAELHSLCTTPPSGPCRTLTSSLTGTAYSAWRADGAWHSKNGPKWYSSEQNSCTTPRDPGCLPTLPRSTRVIVHSVVARAASTRHLHNHDGEQTRTSSVASAIPGGVWSSFAAQGPMSSDEDSRRQ